MRHPTTNPQLFDKPDQRRIAGKTAIGYGFVYLGQVHPYHPSRANIGMAHLRIAHLPGRQADILTAGFQAGIGAAIHQPVKSRSIGLGHRIQCGIFRHAPTIKNTKNNGLGREVCGGHSCVSRSKIAVPDIHKPTTVPGQPVCLFYGANPNRSASLATRSIRVQALSLQYLQAIDILQ